MKTLTHLTVLVAVAGLSGTLLAQRTPATNECAKTTGMQVYSNVSVHPETGDLLGYELAINRSGDSGLDALLYVFEGGDSGTGIPLTGQIIKGQVNIRGTWEEHLVEYPSKKETVEEHPVKIRGILAASSFRGELTIGDITKPERVRLKHVHRIWICNSPSPSPVN